MSLLNYSGKIVAELEAGKSCVVESSDGRQDYPSLFISFLTSNLTIHYRDYTSQLVSLGSSPSIYIYIAG